MDWMVSSSSLLSRILDTVYGDCWFFDVAGGDVVAPGAGFTPGPCSPHSDWTNVKDGVIAVSLIVHEEQDKDTGRLSSKF